MHEVDYTPPPLTDTFAAASISEPPLLALYCKVLVPKYGLHDHFVLVGYSIGLAPLVILGAGLGLFSSPIHTGFGFGVLYVFISVDVYTCGGILKYCEYL